MAEAVVSFVLENVCNLLKENPKIPNGVRHQIQQVVNKFRWIQPFLKDADARKKQDRIARWIVDLRKLTYDAENVIEIFLFKTKSSSISNTGGFSILTYLCSFHHCLHCHKIVWDMERIQRRMDEITTRLRADNIRSIAELGESSNHEVPGKLQRFYSHVIVEPLVVGLQDDVETLVAHLVNENQNGYPVVSICGMGGIGKTTLAKKIYNHFAIKAYFDSLAWVSISHKWQLRNVLQRIFFCFVQNEQRREEVMNLDDAKLMEYLCEIQRSTKCLIVVDDIWTNDAWDCIRPAFPTQRFRSKLMLTSRSVQVSKHVDPNAFLHQPQLLNEEQSWDLLWMRALPNGNHFDARDAKEMEEFGREDIVGVFRWL